ncbi:hypothetical protein [Streptomyces hydrogenans]|uniref:Uncharacterized protein n=1 Tax=Streptomyces hydrogenans TaxID=1873719 RepID=A0ABQ3PJM7_9ACTN|nr:hypothetical protein [Streptomyces hydrogenans]GHG09960.1 hypothetical protein GCM10018784_23270 [Streptomyces hydrogenans]GHI25221.1 hypothetical protein Shyd_65920 [Streptomyces hydrogenans]
MQNKQSLLNLVARAEEGRLLPGEAQILREAIERLDEVCMCLDTLHVPKSVHEGYDASTTQSFRVEDFSLDWDSSGDCRE